MLGTCVQDRLHNSWAPVQNENTGLLVQELLRISKWQAEFQPSACPSECGAREPALLVQDAVLQNTGSQSVSS